MRAEEEDAPVGKIGGDPAMGKSGFTSRSSSLFPRALRRRAMLSSVAVPLVLREAKSSGGSEDREAEALRVDFMGEPVFAKARVLRSRSERGGTDADADAEADAEAEEGVDALVLVNWGCVILARADRRLAESAIAWMEGKRKKREKSDGRGEGDVEWQPG